MKERERERDAVNLYLDKFTKLLFENCAFFKRRNVYYIYKLWVFFFLKLYTSFLFVFKSWKLTKNYAVMQSEIQTIFNCILEFEY